MDNDNERQKHQPQNYIGFHCKGLWIESRAGLGIRVKAYPSDNHALHHGSFKTIDEAMNWCANRAAGIKGPPNWIPDFVTPDVAPSGKVILHITSSFPDGSTAAMTEEDVRELVRWVNEGALD